MDLTIKMMALPKILTKLCVFVWLFVAIGVNAQALNFFQAEVFVRSQSEQERQTAAQAALQEVLVRMSGTRRVLENDSVQAAVDKAQNYVEQFQYSKNTNVNSLNVEFTQVISLTFSASAVEKLLRNAGQPFWPVNRPATLLWLVEDNIDLGKRFVSESTAPEIGRVFIEAAAKRGLPLVQPLYDLEDRIVLSEEKAWALDEASILQASQRYRADVVLVGRFSETSQGQVMATWQFFHRGETKVYDSRADSSEQLGGDALYPLADYLSARYSILPQLGETPMLALQLTGVSNFGGFRRALDYLEGLAIISHVALVSVRGDTMFVHLQSDSSLEKFESTLLLDKKIKRKDTVVPSDLPSWQQVPRGTDNNPLLYHWAG